MGSGRREIGKERENRQPTPPPGDFGLGLALWMKEKLQGMLEIKEERSVGKSHVSTKHKIERRYEQRR